MNFETTGRFYLRILCLVSTLAMVRAFAADTPAASDKDALVSTTPMTFEAEDGGVHGQLVVATEILTPERRNDLIYTITAEPSHGRVGLAGGGDDEDFFKNKTARLGYFAYRAQDDFVGDDSFAYTVRNETSGLMFKNTVAISVKPPGPLVLQKLEVSAVRDRILNVRGVSLTTRPNTPVAQKVPSHEDFMSPGDRGAVVTPKVAYLLDDKAKPQNGTAKLDRATGQLTY